MNIFYLDPDPKICAEMHCDKHVCKMAIEYAQMLSTAHRVLDGTHFVGHTTNGRKITRWFHPDQLINSVLYKSTHVSHKSNKWIRESYANYDYVYQLWYWVCQEYRKRYGKTHMSEYKLYGHLQLEPSSIDMEKPFTEPPLAMDKYPECKVTGDAVTSYRKFYIKDKASFAKWTGTEIPFWWPHDVISDSN